MKYQVVKAKTREEAIEKCRWYVGQEAIVSDLTATGDASTGEWTVLPEFMTRVDFEEENERS